MRCGQCGAAVGADDGFCGSCGSALNPPAAASADSRAGGELLADYPAGARRCLYLSLFASVFIAAGWAKHVLFTPPGAFIGFAVTVTAWVLTLAALLAGTGVPLFYGVGNLFVEGRRRVALRVVIAAAVPLLLHLAIQFYLVDVKGIDFD